MTMLTAQQRLEDAQRALHEFQMGRLSVEVEHDGRKVRYNRTNIDALSAYITGLQAEVANRRPRVGAIGFIF